MTPVEMEKRASELLLEQKRLARFNLTLPPDLLALLDRLLRRLGWVTRVPMSRRKPYRYSQWDQVAVDMEGRGKNAVAARIKWWKAAQEHLHQIGQWDEPLDRNVPLPPTLPEWVRRLYAVEAARRIQVSRRETGHPDTDRAVSDAHEAAMRYAFGIGSTEELTDAETNLERIHTGHHTVEDDTEAHAASHIGLHSVVKNPLYAATGAALPALHEFMGKNPPPVAQILNPRYKPVPMSRRKPHRYAKRPAAPQRTYPDFIVHAGAVLDNPRDNTAVLSMADHLYDVHPGDPHVAAFIDWANGTKTWQDISPVFRHAVVKPVANISGWNHETGGPYIYLQASGLRGAIGQHPPETSYGLSPDRDLQSAGQYAKRAGSPYWEMVRPSHNVRWIPRPDFGGSYRRGVTIPGTRATSTEIAQHLYDTDGVRSLLLAVIGARHYHPDKPTGTYEVRFSRRTIKYRYTRDNKSYWLSPTFTHVIKPARAPEVERRLRGLFGPDFAYDDLARACGALPGSTVEFDPGTESSHEVEVNIIHPDLNAGRILYRGPDGTPYLDAIHQRAEPTIHGAGWKRFGDTLPYLRALGVTRIKTSAAGDARPETNNGYYTWPRFGFNGELTPDHLRRLEDGSPGITAELDRRGKRDFHTLFTIPGADKLWQKHGSTAKVEFELHPDSPHSKYYEEYANERRNRPPRNRQAGTVPTHLSREGVRTPRGTGSPGTGVRTGPRPGGVRPYHVLDLRSCAPRRLIRPRVNYRYAKAEQTRHPAHHTVASFPLEFALRHLANDGSAAPELRDTAKHVLTTGDVNGLWTLHDLVHRHRNADGTEGHPVLRAGYNFMSAADKLGLDRHTHTALHEEAERTRRSQGASPHDDLPHYRPEYHAHVLARALSGGDKSTHPQVAEALDRVRTRVASLSGERDRARIDESILRHGHRAGIEFRRQNGIDGSGDEARSLAPVETKPSKDLAPFVKRERASRYRRKTFVVRYAKVNRSNFINALRRMTSSNHSALTNSARDIAKRMGVTDTHVLPALHDSPGGTTPGVAQAVYGSVAPETVHELASWVNGLVPNGPGYAVFHPRPNGPDTLYRVRHIGSGTDVRSRLDRAGIKNRVLLPHRKGFDVLIPDAGNAMAKNVAQYAATHGLPLEASPGHFQTVGGGDQAQNRATFRNKVVAGERSRMSRGVKRYTALVPLRNEMDTVPKPPGFDPTGKSLTEILDAIHHWHARMIVAYQNVANGYYQVGNRYAAQQAHDLEDDHRRYKVLTRKVMRENDQPWPEWAKANNGVPVPTDDDYDLAYSLIGDRTTRRPTVKDPAPDKPKELPPRTLSRRRPRRYTLDINETIRQNLEASQRQHAGSKYTQNHVAGKVLADALDETDQPHAPFFRHLAHRGGGGNLWGHVTEDGEFFRIHTPEGRLQHFDDSDGTRWTFALMQTGVRNKANGVLVNRSQRTSGSTHTAVLKAPALRQWAMHPQVGPSMRAHMLNAADHLEDVERQRTATAPPPGPDDVDHNSPEFRKPRPMSRRRALSCR